MFRLDLFFLGVLFLFEVFDMDRVVRNVIGVKWVLRYDVWLGSIVDCDFCVKYVG